jgi:carbamoyl-phosphate synthase small subunit
MKARLVLADGSSYPGTTIGSCRSVAGEVVFNTGMVGYPESFTDPSYKGQILVMTYPLIGNYGLREESAANGLSRFFESSRSHLTGLIVAECSQAISRRGGELTLDQWLKAEGVPGLADVDTRGLTQRLRTAGSMPGKLLFANDDVAFVDPNEQNLVAQVSTDRPVRHGSGGNHVVVIDCGCKNNILRMLLQRRLAVTVVPWNWPLPNEPYDGVVISNGPGDPEVCTQTIQTIRSLLATETPIFGICLGHQLLALAAGAATYKLKYGHRGQNQPCVQVGTKRCFITSQNHGYAVAEPTLPAAWRPWFYNANDGSNEGIRHVSRPFCGVQFHPEASPGPLDTEFLFDEFADLL